MPDDQPARPRVFQGVLRIFGDVVVRMAAINENDVERTRQLRPIDGRGVAKYLGDLSLVRRIEEPLSHGLSIGDIPQLLWCVGGELAIPVARQVEGACLG